MANNRKLLLPYAYDSTGNLVHIDNAHKEEIYKCPECGKILSLNISKIPEGQKYHRRNHFSHPKGSPDNKCSESFLHKLFKERVATYIQKQITDGVTELTFTWECNECSNRHSGNLLRKAKSVCLEYTLDNCRPDIVLLDNDGKAVIVIEVVVTHSPEPEVLEYYKRKGIGCLQFNVSDYNDCEHIEDKLSRPDSVNLCPTPICKKCGQKMNIAKMFIVDSCCWKCKRNMKIAMIDMDNHGLISSPNKFTEEEVRLANENGVFLTMNYSRQIKKSYLANTCKHCKAYIGEFFIHNYYCMPHEKEIELGYKCYSCFMLDKQEKQQGVIAKNNLEHMLKGIIMRDGVKICPKCQCELVIKCGTNGYFYECGNYPNCQYSETIKIQF